MELKIRRLLIMALCLIMVLPLTGIMGTSDGAAYKYVGSVNSDIYHYPECSYVKTIYDKNKIFFESAVDAASHGYRPCKKCQPPTSDSAAIDQVQIPLPSTVPVTAAPSSISVKVNRSFVPMTDSQPFVENGRTYVPVRAVLEAYGVDSITWAAPNVIVTRGDVTLKIPVGQNYIDKNGVNISIDSPAMIRDARTCLPIRAVIEALGGTVGWDADTKTVLITGPGNGQAPITSNDSLKVSFIDVGQGDAIFLDLNDTDILIDAGDKSSGDSVVNYLKSQGVDDLELVIATHAHADHIGGLPEVFGSYRVERYIDSGVPATSQIFADVQSKVASEGCPASGDKSEIISYGDLSVEIIETVDASDDVNNTSVVALVTYGKEKMLFAGDASESIDPWLIKLGHVNLYKAEHHGSRTGNSSVLLSVLHPDISAISYSIGNSYGHPHQEALDSLKKYSGQVVWTAGKTITVITDGTTMGIQ